MPNQIPDTARAAARTAIKNKLAGPLFQGYTLDAVAAEIADAALDSARPAIEQHVRQQIADEFTRRGHTQDTFTWGEAALIARGEI